MSVFDKIGADRLADEVAALVDRRVIDMRSPAADALLDYRNPPRSERSDALVEARAEIERLRALLHSPELHDFREAIVLEAAHQRERWNVDHDGGKTPADWFWLIGYLAGKALHAHAAGDVDKTLHHIITTAAACANWHASALGQTTMRPGIAPPAA